MRPRGDLFQNPDDPALQCNPAEATIRDTKLIGATEPFEIFLKGTTNNPEHPSGWQEVVLPGPCMVRSAIVGAGDILTNANYQQQYLGFLYAPGPREPQNFDKSVQSKGIGEGYCWHGGVWWFRPVRPDIQVKIVFFPMACNEISPWAVEQGGAANFHSHYGIKLATMANDGVDPTVPASTTYFLLYSYHIRKCLLVYVPRFVYVNNGGANWTQAGDTLVDQSTTGALLGVSEYLLGTNLTRYNQWDVAPPTLIGQGLKTLAPGCSFDYSDARRFPGPMFLFNLNRSGPTYIVVEEIT